MAATSPASTEGDPAEAMSAGDPRSLGGRRLGLTRCGAHTSSPARMSLPSASVKSGSCRTSGSGTRDRCAGCAGLGHREAVIDLIARPHHPKLIVPDLESGKSPICGAREGGACNGRFGWMGDHSFFVLDPFVDLERCALPPGRQGRATGFVAAGRFDERRGSSVQLCHVAVSRNSARQDRIPALSAAAMGVGSPSKGWFDRPSGEGRFG